MLELIQYLVLAWLGWILLKELARVAGRAYRGEPEE